MAPEQIGLIQLIAQSLIKQNKHSEAIEFIDSLSFDEDAGKGAYCENLKGQIYIQTQRHGDAMEHFRKAVKLQPDYISPLMNLGNLLLKKGKLQEALTYYKQVEKINPEYSGNLFSIAAIYDLKGDKQSAKEYYRKTLATMPDHPDAANNLAFILSEKPETIEEAFRLVKIAYNKKPKDPNVIDTRGWIYYQKGSYRNAISDFRESLQYNPDSALTNYHLGMALYQLKKYEEARGYLKKAIQIDPDFEGAAAAKEMLN